jgi:hypothetical protein
MTIRWEETENGDWHEYSGELVVALAAPDRAGRKGWLWEVTVQRPPKWRNEGHRTTELAAAVQPITIEFDGAGPLPSSQTSRAW